MHNCDNDHDACEDDGRWGGINLLIESYGMQKDDDNDGVLQYPSSVINMMSRYRFELEIRNVDEKRSVVNVLISHCA